MKDIMRTLSVSLIFFVAFHFSLQATPTQPTVLDRFFFRQLSIDSGDEENYRIQDQTGFGSAPSSELTDKASGFLDSLGYHVFDIGLYYIHSFTTDKAQELINQKIKALNKNYSKYVLFGYGLSSNGINHQVFIKWGDETEEISIQNKNDFVVALGDAMIGKSASAGPSANTIDETEIWALEKIADFFESDNSFLAMSLPEENSGGLQAHLLTRSNDDEIVQTPIGLQISNNGILVSPSGVPIKIPKKTIISFQHGNQYENLLFAGCLIKFLLPNGETYAAMATRKDSTSNIPKDFAGFFNIITKKKYAYEGFEVSTSSFYPVILGDHLSASDDDCNTTYLSKIEFKPYQVDKYGVGHRNFVLDLKDEGQIAELQDLFWIETDLPSMRYCLPRHTSEQIQKAEEKVYNPYNMGGVRIKANSTVLGGVPTFFYGYYDYDEPDIMFYFYWSPEDLTWLEFTPNEAEETVFNFMQLMSDMGHLYKQMAEDVWSVFKGTAFTLHGALDLIGLIPIIGEPADILNGIIYAAEGDKMNAVLSFGAIVPVAGIASTVGKHLQPYTTKVWNVAKKIRLTKIRKVCSIGLKGEEEPVNRSSGCQRIIRNIDPAPILARAKALKLPENTIIKLQNDLFEGGDEFVTLLKENNNAVSAWVVAFKHGDDIRINTDFLGKLSQHLHDFPNLKPDIDDLGVFNAYKKIANDLEQSYEILDDVDGNLALLIAQKTQNSNASNFWKWIRNGKKFETDYLLPKFKNRSSTEYIQLKNKASTEFGVNLDEFDMYSQVQLKYYGNDYFVADQVYVKWVDINGQQVIDDIVVIENKLNSTTRLTKSQNAGKAASSLEVRSVNLSPESSVSGNNLTNQIPLINTNNKWLKVYDSENGDVISGIDKI